MQTMIEGWVLKPYEVLEAERKLESEPEDLALRMKLISYYFQNAMTHQRLPHVYWLIEHHPESRANRESYVMVSPRPLINSYSDYRHGKELWLKQVEAHASDPRVLGNAASYIGQEDPFAAEDLLSRARAADPNDPEWVRRLADLYRRAIEADLTPTSWFARDGMNATFISKVKTYLETTSGAVFPALVGSMLVEAELSSIQTGHPEVDAAFRELDGRRRQYGELLLARARTLDPNIASGDPAVSTDTACPSALRTLIPGCGAQ